VSMPLKILRLCAFRYAMGLKTMLVLDVIEEISDHWKEMEGFQKQIQDDIRHAIYHGIIGDNMDVEVWSKILKLEVTE